MTQAASPPVSLRYAATARGRVHYAECGSGSPVLLLHQTPRSWDEYADVLPLLGTRQRALAMDTLGFGASDAPAADRVDAYAAGVLALLDALGIDRVTLVGHHTGGVVALETAATAPERVAALVLSSTPWIDGAARERRRARPPIDEVSVSADGRHLAELWERRRPYYPEGRPDILERFVRDALRVGTARLEAGHQAVTEYPMERRVGRVRCPVLCVGSSADPFAFPDLRPLARRLPGARCAVLEGGTVAAPEQCPARFAQLIQDFLDDLPVHQPS